ncbi:MAG TPA: lytic transglycosylase domain-containing protein [Bacillota bacterium]|nr:lytic transglycosylase domain-containing protein [Bacillota bacterium]
MVNLDSLMLLIRMQQLEQLQKLNVSGDTTVATDSSSNFASILSGMLSMIDASGDTDTPSNSNTSADSLLALALGSGSIFGMGSNLGLGATGFSQAINDGTALPLESDPGVPKQAGTVTASALESTSSASGNLDQLFNELAAKYSLSPNLLKTVAEAESGLNPNAVSSAGAQGIMQLMPATARGLGVADTFDPAQNIEGGAKYLKSLLDRFDNDLSLALAAYNAGPNAVKRYGGVPPYKETQNYVRKIMDNLVDLTG